MPVAWAPHKQIDETMWADLNTCQSKLNTNKYDNLITVSVLSGAVRRPRPCSAVSRDAWRTFRDFPRDARLYHRTEGLSCSGPLPATHTVFLEEGWRGRVPCKALPHRGVMTRNCSLLIQPLQLTTAIEEATKSSRKSLSEAIEETSPPVLPCKAP